MNARSAYQTKCRTRQAVPTSRRSDPRCPLHRVSGPGAGTASHPDPGHHSGSPCTIRCPTPRMGLPFVRLDPTASISLDAALWPIPAAGQLRSSTTAPCRSVTRSFRATPIASICPRNRTLVWLLASHRCKLDARRTSVHDRDVAGHISSPSSIGRRFWQPSCKFLSEWPRKLTRGEPTRREPLPRRTRGASAVNQHGW